MSNLHYVCILSAELQSVYMDQGKILPGSAQIIEPLSHL